MPEARVYLPNNGSDENRLDFQGVTVSGNTADAGAGFALQGDGSTPGSGTLANSTVAGNTTPGGEQDCAFVGAPPPAQNLSSGGRQRGG